MLAAAITAILAVVVFAVAMQSFITDTFISVNSLFYSGTYAEGYTASAYLSLGFWLALVSAIIAFLAYLGYPKIAKAIAPAKSV